nr:hypothetical protein [Tanacetum cinerariifolium]
MSRMSYPSASMSSGSRTARGSVEFGRTYVVRPKGKHQATIVWLHGLGDNGSSWSQLLDNLPLPNIKWICPTAPTRPVTALGGFPCTASACFAQGRYGNGNPYPINLRAVVGLSGWLPGARNLRNKINTNDAARRAASLPILLCHGQCTYYKLDASFYITRQNKLTMLNRRFMSSAGFRYVTFRSYDGLGHYTVPKEMEEVCQWLNA